MPTLTPEELEALRAEVKALRAPLLDRERADRINAALNGVKDPMEAVEVMVTHGFLPVDWTDENQTARTFEHPSDSVAFRVVGGPSIVNGQCLLHGIPLQVKALEALGMVRPDGGPDSDVGLTRFPARALDPELFRNRETAGGLAIVQGRLSRARPRRQETYPASVAQVATLAYHASAVATAENLYREMLAFMNAPADTRVCWALREGRFPVRVPRPVRFPYIPPSSRPPMLFEPSFVFRPADPMGYVTGVDRGGRRDITVARVNEGGLFALDLETDMDLQRANITRAIGVPEEYLRGGNSSAPRVEQDAELFRNAADALLQPYRSGRRARPLSLVAQDIVSVQPMTAPVGRIFYMDPVYGSSMQAPEPPKNRYSHYTFFSTERMLHRSPPGDNEVGEDRSYLAPWLVALWRCAVEHPDSHVLSLDPRGFPWS